MKQPSCDLHYIKRRVSVLVERNEIGVKRGKLKYSSVIAAERGFQVINLSKSSKITVWVDKPYIKDYIVK
jgi:hypothetical protein